MSIPKGAEAFIQRVAREAGDVVLKRFGKDGVHYAKSEHAWDVVTKADLASEKLIISAIKKHYPEHGIISEESGNHNDGAQYIWVIDPIDGTMNYSRSVPLFGVMICLVYQGEVVLSVINMPATKEFFYAKRGGGARLNGKRIHCSRKKELAQSTGITSSSYSKRAGAFVSRLVKANKRTHIHGGSFGSMTTLACYAAAGRRDWAVALNGSIWDYAPAYLILKEAGCKVTDTKGKPWRFGVLEFVAANPALHKQLLKLTKGI